MYVRTAQRLGQVDNGKPWRRYREVVTQVYGRGTYDIALQRLDGVRPSQYRRLGAINQAAGSALTTGAAVGTTVAITQLAPEIGAWAGPIGAAAGALVGIVLGLFQASAARAKGAKEENQAINEYLPAWDQGLKAIFSAANAGTATPAECISALQTLMQQWWAAAAQFHGLPGVADASNGGASCGTYTPNVTPACSPSNGPGCDKSCTAFCCIGCYDLAPSAAFAAYLFGLPTGGTLNVCTVYASKYGASQRSQYSVTYTPPAASSAGGVAVAAATDTGIPVWALVLGGAAAAYYLL
jgi:hypothetical protein